MLYTYEETIETCNRISLLREILDLVGICFESTYIYIYIYIYIGFLCRGSGVSCLVNTWFVFVICFGNIDSYVVKNGYKCLLQIYPNVWIRLFHVFQRRLSTSIQLFGKSKLHWIFCHISNIFLRKLAQSWTPKYLYGSARKPCSKSSLELLEFIAYQTNSVILHQSS